MVNHSTLSDEDLLQLMQSGDEDAFLALYRRRQGAIYRFALRMSGVETVAEDVTQEVFMCLIRREIGFDSTRGTVAGYLFGIARNQVLKRFEKDRGLTSIDDEEGGEDGLDERLVTESNPLGDLTQRELIESVRSAVLSLPVHYREVVVLCDLNEMSYAEAALAIGCAVGTVRSRLHRARGMLVERLRDVHQSQTRLTGPETCYV
jgi:RNA polymerase sigma-70 factor (ECF subfamily)